MTLDLYDLRRERGGQVYAGGRRWIGPGPGHSRHDASLSVSIEPGGRVLIHSFAGDPFPECAAYIGLRREEASRPDPATLARLRRERELEARERRNAAWEFCDGVWAGAQPLSGTPAEAYLRSRGLEGPFTPDLRFHPAAPLSYERRRTVPALVAMVRSAAGQARGLHVTALRPDGSDKAPIMNPRRMFGACAGGSVQLAPLDERACLAVAEGIETALSFAVLNEGFPTWAALSTAGLQTFEPPALLQALTIAADGDKAGRHAARMLAHRARKRCDVTVLAPSDETADYNDLLRGSHGG